MKNSDEWVARIITAILVLASFIAVWALYGCKTTERIYDTQYITKIAKDSIFVHDSVMNDYKIGQYFTDTVMRVTWRVDTIYKTCYKTQYKDRLLIDTMYIYKEEERVTQQPVERVVSAWEAAMRYIKHAVLVALLLCVVVFVIKKWKTIQKIFGKA